jgi:hypothetical protein
MPNINVSVPDQTSREEALRRIQNFVAQIKAQYSPAITDFQETWDGNSRTFSGRGFSLARRTSLRSTTSRNQRWATKTTI